MGSEAAKDGQGSVWGSAPYERIAETLAGLHDHPVSSLAPALIETARCTAADECLDVRFDVGPAKRLPYDDASFDAVSSLATSLPPPPREALARAYCAYAEGHREDGAVRLPRKYLLVLGRRRP